MEKIVKDQSELINNLHSENEFLHSTIEQKTATIQELEKNIFKVMSIAEDWEKVANNWKELSDNKDLVIKEYQKFIADHFNSLLDQGAIKAEHQEELRNFIKQLKDE